MAIVLDPTSLLCEFDDRPAVAFGRWQYPDPKVTGRWWLYCRQCLKYDAIDPREFQVVYLNHVDPAGSRGTDSERHASANRNAPGAVPGNL